MTRKTDGLADHALEGEPEVSSFVPNEVTGTYRVGRPVPFMMEFSRCPGVLVPEVPAQQFADASSQVLGVPTKSRSIPSGSDCESSGSTYDLLWSAWGADAATIIASKRVQ